MKKLLAFILAALVFATNAGTQAMASNTADALWSGVVRITNNSTAASVVSVNFTANTTVLIANAYMNSSANNTSLQIDGSDVAYMPGYAGSPWAVYAETMAANEIKDGTLYLGGTTDMASKLRWFPSSAGGTVADNASLEHGANFADTFSGYVDTTAGAAKYLIKKISAFQIVTGLVAGNITAGITPVAVTSAYVLRPDGAGDETNISGLTGAATHWQAVNDSSDASYVSTSSVGGERDLYSLSNNTTNTNEIYSVVVTYRARNAVVGDSFTLTPHFKIGGTVYNGSTTTDAPFVFTNYSQTFTNSPATSATWTQAEINAMQLGMTLGNVVGTQSQAADIYATVNYITGYTYAASVSSAGVASGEHDIIVWSDSTNLHMSVDGIETSNTTTAAIPDNTNSYVIGSSATPYIESVNMTV